MDWPQYLFLYHLFTNVLFLFTPMTMCTYWFPIAGFFHIIIETCGPFHILFPKSQYALAHFGLWFFQLTAMISTFVFIGMGQPLIGVQIFQIGFFLSDALSLFVGLVLIWKPDNNFARWFGLHLLTHGVIGAVFMPLYFWSIVHTLFPFVLLAPASTIQIFLMRFYLAMKEEETSSEWTIVAQVSTFHKNLILFLTLFLMVGQMQTVDYYQITNEQCESYIKPYKLVWLTIVALTALLNLVMIFYYRTVKVKDRRKVSV